MFDLSWLYSKKFNIINILIFININIYFDKWGVIFTILSTILTVLYINNYYTKYTRLTWKVWVCEPFLALSAEEGCSGCGAGSGVSAHTGPSRGSSECASWNPSAGSSCDKHHNTSAPPLEHTITSVPNIVMRMIVTFKIMITKRFFVTVKLPVGLRKKVINLTIVKLSRFLF